MSFQMFKICGDSLYHLLTIILANFLRKGIFISNLSVDIKYDTKLLACYISLYSVIHDSNATDYTTMRFPAKNM